jgi:hypothetical protein
LKKSACHHRDVSSFGRDAPPSCFQRRDEHDPTPAEKQRQKMELLTASVKGGMPPPPGVKNVEAA